MHPMMMILWIASLLFGHWMSVIEPNQSFAVPGVQCQRIVQPMRLFRHWLDSGYNKPTPMPTFKINNQRKTIEFQQGVKRGVVSPHAQMLSLTDNNINTLASVDLLLLNHD
jgi:hypothetical protein